MNETQHVFLVGAKSLGAYGGYETFIDKLTEYHQEDTRLQYHVACKANGIGYMDEKKLRGVTRISDSEFIYHNAHCFKIPVQEKLGPAQAVYYDIMALKKCCRIIREEKIPHPIVYIMACRVGPFMKKYYDEIHALGGRVFLNPDGHEWMRAKWNRLIKQYWKLSERLMVRYSDLVICDSRHIERYIHSRYDAKGIGGTDPKTTYIAYGAETRKSLLADEDPRFVGWLREQNVRPGEYYLAVGRLVPENNFGTMVQEFMASGTKRDFVIIANRNRKYRAKLEERLHPLQDSRIRFAGTVYDKELLMKIRENARGYFHGHEVGGTNPSLLEGLASTSVNMPLDVGFNREVAQDAGLYWSKEPGDLAALIRRADSLPQETIDELGRKAKARIREAYSWEFISGRYAEEFLK